MMELHTYISARDNADGVYGIGRVQYEGGIQIKELVDPGKAPPKGGVFRDSIQLLLHLHHRTLEEAV